MINTISSYYNSSLQNEINKTSKKLATGKEITQGFEDSNIFKKNLELDNDISLMNHLKENAESAKATAQYTDTTLDSMTQGLEQFKVKLLGYGGREHSTTSREALAGELKSIKESLVQLSNTQVNGEYILGGTKNKIPPIDQNGNYQGNDKKMSIKIDKFQTQEYSIDGQSLFLGYDRNVHSSISTNVQKLNLTDLNLEPPQENYIKPEDSIKDLTGTDEKTFFYMSGVRPDGSTFKHKFEVSDSENTTVADLREEIKLQFNDEVTVEVNNAGQFIIEDKSEGNSKLNFNLIGSTQDVTNLQDLEPDKTFEFIHRNGIDDNIGDKMQFKKDGNVLKNNIQQFVSVDEGFATSKTKLSEVASGSLLGRTLNLDGKNINGDEVQTTLTFNETSTTVTINGASFELDGGAEDFTYQQLNEVTAIALAGTEGNGDFQTAINEANQKVSVKLNSHGEMEIRDLTSSQSKIEISLYDSETDDFSTNQGTPLSFNSNKAIDVDRPAIDLFKSLDDAIEAIEQDLTHPDATRIGFEDNLGFQESIDKITHAIDHVSSQRTVTGTQMQNINYSIDRSEALITNMKITQNDAVNIDFAETSAYYNALSLNYQAMLSTIAKVQSLSLVNYI